MQAILDKSAIGFSLLCAIHCLVIPLAMVMLPSLAVLPLENEAFHFWMILVVIPTSAIALTMGCKKHKTYQLMIVGTIGLMILMAAAFIEESLIGEFWEKTLTFIGAIIIAHTHYKNYRLCSLKESCPCPGSIDELNKKTNQGQ